MKKNLLLFVFLLFCVPLIGFSQIYSADFSVENQGFPDHSTSNPPAEGPASAMGENWTLSYQNTPSTDGSGNVFSVDNGTMLTTDWGGEGTFESSSIDVSSIDAVDISAMGVTVGGSVQNGSSEFFEYYYKLDGSSTSVAIELNNDNAGTPVNLDLTSIDVSGVSTLVVGFRFNVNGGGDGYRISSFTVTEGEDSDFPDADEDGVSDEDDQEPNSPCPDDVDTNGVSNDDDEDGIPNCNDQEADSPCSDNVDSDGVSTDMDGDGVLDCFDSCPETPADTPVDASGCAIEPLGNPTCDSGSEELYFESFDGNGDGYTTSITEFTDGSEDYFTKIGESTDINNGVQFTGGDGDFFGAQDIDGEGADLPVFLTTNTIDVSNIESFIFSIDLAEDDDGSKQDWDGSDYVHIQTKFDTEEAWSNQIYVESETTSTNGAPRIDTNFDGVGDGTEITDAFQRFSSVSIPVPEGESSVQIRIVFSLDSGDEDIAIDNIHVCGVQSQCEVDAGAIALEDESTALTACAGSEELSSVSVMSGGETAGENMGWIITDESGYIIGMPTASPFDLSGAEPGVCQIWKIVYDGELSGLEMDNNVGAIEGCYDLSNAITVTREDCPPPCEVDAGAIALEDESTELTACAGSEELSSVSVMSGGETAGENMGWIITDESGYIIGMPTASPFDLSGAEPGVCQIWKIVYDGELSGLEMDNNVGALEGCYDLSNAITVTREECNQTGCPTEDLVLRTQAQVNAFPEMYPGCSSLDIGIVVRGNNIDDLTPLSQLTKVKHMVVFKCPRLTNLAGLENLTEVTNALSVRYNNSLTSIAELSTSGATYGSLYITNNRLVSTCEIDAVCTHVSTTKYRRIRANATGCRSVTEVRNACASAGRSATSAEEVKVSPNPAMGDITITGIELKTATPSVQVMDSYGNVVMQQDKVSVNGKQLSMNVSTLKKGVYYVVIKDGATVHKTSFVKM